MVQQARCDQGHAELRDESEGEERHAEMVVMDPARLACLGALRPQPAPKAERARERLERERPEHNREEVYGILASIIFATCRSLSGGQPFWSGVGTADARRVRSRPRTQTMLCLPISAYW